MKPDDEDTLRVGCRVIRFYTLTAIEHRALVGVALAVFFARLNDRPRRDGLAAGPAQRLAPDAPIFP